MDRGEGTSGGGAIDGVRVSVFDESVENHFKAMDTISKLCGEVPFSADDSEIQRLSSSVTFLREWKQFQYQPRTIRFASETGGPEGKCVSGEIKLPQFSSATVPKVEDGQDGASTSAGFSKDFVMHVGGSVWALDWCPRVHSQADDSFKCEFIAVAAHPPESYYHKIGAPLIGRGVVQIWCILNVNDNAEEPTPIRKTKQTAGCHNEAGEGKSIQTGRLRGRPRKTVEEATDKGGIKRPRGRPRKNQTNDCIEQALVVHPEGSSELLALEGIPKYTQQCDDQNNNKKKRKSSMKAASESTSALKTPGESTSKEETSAKSSNDQTLTQKNEGSSPMNHHLCKNTGQDLVALKKPRGQPGKKATDESPDSSNCIEQALTIQHPVGTSELFALERIPENALECNNQKNNKKTRKSSIKAAGESNTAPKAPRLSRSEEQIAAKCSRDITSTQNEMESTSHMDHQIHKNSELELSDLSIQALAVQYPEDSSKLLALKGSFKKIEECVDQKNNRASRKSSIKAVSVSSAVATPGQSVLGKADAAKSSNDVTQNKKGVSFSTNHQTHNDSGQDPVVAKYGSELPVLEGVTVDPKEHTKQKSKGKSLISGGSAPNSTNRTSSLGRSEKASFVINSSDALSTQNEKEGSLTISHQLHENSGHDLLVTNYVSDKVVLVNEYASCSIPNDVALPRVVLCLAHNGKVVWDMKWRHPSLSESHCHYRMGYLAVLLGNGSLEVWDIPVPHTMKWIYYSSLKEGTDPRFVKLDPVFRCSRLKCGETQSIPLTVEWSSHDYLLVGCHDGTVALWKFAASAPSRETRPLLCFGADTVPIRAVAWAPVESSQESKNVILTAGHVGLKFWDIRDPCRPLWDIHPAPKFIYSLDWLPDPKCIILSFDDGTMRLLSLTKAAYDAPVNGNPTVGPKQQGIHIFNCSSFAIWSVQVSRLTGMVAYCSADGTVSRFQLTTKAVEKEPSRYRTPHFVCGFLSQEESAIIVNTPLSDAPLSCKKQVGNVTNNSKSATALVSLKSNHDEAANQPLALGYGDPGGGYGHAKTWAAFETERKSKSKSSSRKKNEESRALVCIDEEQDNLPEKAIAKVEAADRIESIPPKLIAMQRVRWNMNKGSERWLCSGGAAGIVRCQEITMTEFDKTLAKKR